ncbi:hypothetical protein ES332_D08G138700v1 [Gossypium tomentosum]|uniref:Uncharacterized protein n=1 Tax=Gossypium tomentosum TaxID=34277 RepID=A0A5D2JTS0_GOSTO|nr:hypothetical protein ES332_D08G138700v1 [Gossypium tomentosum]
MCVCNLTNAKEWLYIAENKMKITKENYGGGCGWGERRYVEGSLRAAVLKILETLGASENFRFRLQCNWAGVSGYCNWVGILG